MRFEIAPTSEAEGAILAHSLALPGLAFKKGRKLSVQDIRLLAKAGVSTLMVARPADSDMAEDAAATRIAHAFAGGHVHVGEAFTGRANLYAAAQGLVTFDPDAIIALNSIDEGLTVASLPRFEPVNPRQMLATVKIIPFALPAKVVAEAEALIAANSAGRIEVAPFRAAQAGLVLTQLPGTKPSVLDKRRVAVETRLRAAGAALVRVETCAHEIAAIAEKIGALRDAGCDPILIFGASAIVDRGDVVPAGLVAAGGAIVRLGLPVDPGNLLMLGRLGAVDVIGVPSCAASPKVNGFDWVLQRRLARLSVGATEIAAMSAGGLLKEIATRPQPRDGATAAVGSRAEPSIGAVVLAAGRSTRMGPRNKLLEPVDGVPMVRHAALAALGSRARPVIVVTGHMPEDVTAALAGLDIQFIRNRRFADGLSTSLAAGIGALPAGLDGAVIVLGDMPDVTAAHIDKLIASFAPGDGRAICVAMFEGKRGNPVVFAAEFFSRLQGLEGDAGARQLLGQFQDQVAEVDVGSPAVLIDVDTPQALDALRGGLRSKSTA